jgi:hypothetical protein
LPILYACNHTISNDSHGNGAFKSSSSWLLVSDTNLNMVGQALVDTKVHYDGVFLEGESRIEGCPPDRSRSLTPLKRSREEVDGGRKRRFDGGYNRSFENNNILSSDLQKSKDNTGFYMAEADDEKYSLKVFSSFQPKEMTKSPQPNFGNHHKKSAGVATTMATDQPT